MNINKDIINYSNLGAGLSYVDNAKKTDYDGYSKVSYIEASDSIKAKCGNKEITILDSNGNTKLQRIYIKEDDSFISNLDTLISIFVNNFTEEQAKELCRNIGKTIDATSNY